MKVILRFLKLHRGVCFVTVALAFIDVLGALVILICAAEMLNVGAAEGADHDPDPPPCAGVL